MFWYSMVFALLLAAACLWVWRAYGPVDTRIMPDYGADKPVFYEGVALEGTAVGSGDALKLPLPMIQAAIDESATFEEASKSVILTTDSRVVRLATEQLTAWVNDRPFELRFPTETIDGVVYVPAEPLERFYGVRLDEAADTGFVTLRKPGDVTAWVSVPEPDESADASAAPVPARLEPTVRSAIVGELAPGERAAVWGEAAGWYRVQLPNGAVGYAEKTALRWNGTETYAPETDERFAPYVPKRPMGEKIQLTWEQVYNRNPDTSAIGPMPGVNVVSPTWFHVMDETGALENRADKSYSKWAHGRGYQVWAIFTNDFDPDLTSAVLASYDVRMNMARQLLGFAELYELDGINVDFENVHVKDGPALTQFMRELTPLLHEAGLTVSIDVTFASGSENWSMFYDRRALGAIVDYMMIMAYDEHWASSPVAGSVASLPWVEDGVRRIIEDHGVPADKIVLGVPFYTRIWTEEPSDQGGAKVSSKAVGMDAVERLIAEKGLKPTFDEATGQHYVEYEEDGAVKKIWIEDETSMRSRAALVGELGLAGIASWSRNFASADIWTVIDETLRSR